MVEPVPLGAIITTYMWVTWDHTGVYKTTHTRYVHFSVWRMYIVHSDYQRCLALWGNGKKKSLYSTLLLLVRLPTLPGNQFWKSGRFWFKSWWMAAAGPGSRVSIYLFLCNSLGSLVSNSCFYTIYLIVHNYCVFSIYTEWNTYHPIPININLLI